MATIKDNWPDYRPQIIERKQQQLWEKSDLHLTSQTADRPKFYCLDFFPYPSGDGLHVGHCRNYVPTDVISRYKRMQGFNVLHPMGWDSFGEPTEEFAVQHGISPRVTTDSNTANFKRQFTIIGTSYDWSREIDSSHPDYYRWTQWFFLLLYRRGLAYRDANWQWWCPVCQTTLSSHEAAGGVCWRGHSGVTKREIPAWYFKITEYADSLLQGLTEIEWPESIKAMQRNWIGRSEGVEVDFRLDGGGLDSEERVIRTFTTRPDTLFGVTFFALAPEHPLALKITAPERKEEVALYADAAVRQSDIERASETRPKTGIFTGAYILNPVNKAPVPVWVADYVLPSYGTGAVMGVPAHDHRDYEFAIHYGLPVTPVISPRDVDLTTMDSAYTGEGFLINSGNFDGMSSSEASELITGYLEEQGFGRRTVHYRMHDWLISRQRYWGTPIPIIYCEACGEKPVPVEQLPVLLPPMDSFEPDGSGRSPLARLDDFVNVDCPNCGGPAKRETDTMGGFACSSWYFLRFPDPTYSSGPFNPESVNYWLPVDLYVGGAEHAVLHLLYARFWVKVMADAGLLPFNEPFQKLLNQGQLIGLDGARMSKSRGNVITPDSVVNTYGADALRLYVMFLAPFEQDVHWSTEGINGVARFLNRLWTLYKETWRESSKTSARDPELERMLHRTIRQATERIEQFRFNTMVSSLMEFMNALIDRQRRGNWKTADFHHSLETMLVLLAPSAPHIAEELWGLTGHEGSVHQQKWPAWDPELAREIIQSIAVQVDGKLRDVVEVEAGVGETEVERLAYASPKVSQSLVGREIVKVVHVPGRIMNIVTGGNQR
jgi:leucyl-tRNA synthetase